MMSLTNRTEFSVLTPYPIPRSLRGRKVSNLGDGFILRAIERLIGPFLSDKVYSPRIPLSDATVGILERSPAIILAGANQLHDRYTIWPGLTEDRIRKGKFRFVPFGIGLHGDPTKNRSMTAETKAILDALHEHIEYSSWRCPRTVAYLRQELPCRARQFLMTGCPVLYDRPLLDSHRFHTSEASVAVTATERGEFWDREVQVIDAVERRFPHARRYFVTHQNLSPPTMFRGIRRFLTGYETTPLVNQVEALRLYAKKKGFEIVIPSSADECMQVYNNIDVHVGSRLHAHLLFLSRNKRSFLVAVDGRAVGVSEHLGFPLSTPQELELSWNFDFEDVRRRARESYEVMQEFVKSLDRLRLDSKKFDAGPVCLDADSKTRLS